jgi:GT2 family glycosyltransferase
MTRQADVVVPVYRDISLTRACLESVLEHSGPSLRRLIVVDDCGPDPDMRPMLRRLRDEFDCIRLLKNERNLGLVVSANRGLSLRLGDAVLLNSDTRVTEGWLEECLAVLHDAQTVGAVSPLSNNATFCSVPFFGRGVEPGVLEGAPLDLSSLPRFTEMPTGHGFCLLMRDEVLRAHGLFDPIYGRGYNEENDWCQRVRQAGYVIRRANRALVFHIGQVSFGDERNVRDVVNGRRLVARYPKYLDETRAWEASPQATEAAEAVAQQLGLVSAVGRTDG